MLKAMIISCYLISSVFSRDWPASKWRHDEKAEHECRACKAVLIDIANCPSQFEPANCDEHQPLRASVLTTGSCHCQSITCAGRGWRLAVNGSIVDRIHCKGKEWFTIHGDTVPSAICIKGKRSVPQIIVSRLPSVSEKTDGAERETKRYLSLRN